MCVCVCVCVLCVCVCVCVCGVCERESVCVLSLSVWNEWRPLTQGFQSFSLRGLQRAAAVCQSGSVCVLSAD